MESPGLAVARAWTVTGRGGRDTPEGFTYRNTLMSWVHLHFGSNPALAPAFVGACAAARQREHVASGVRTRG
jgi:cobyrinic acid a,c-diamide synthase